MGDLLFIFEVTEISTGKKTLTQERLQMPVDFHGTWGLF